MAINLSRNSLFSQVTKIGRTFSGSMAAPGAIAGGGYRSLSPGNYLRGFAVGAILQSLPILTWSLTAAWSLLYEVTQTVFLFDWNQPDEQLDRQIEAQWNAYGSILGGAAGNTLGWITCGLLPTSRMFSFNEGLATYVRNEVTEEAFEEMMFNASSVIRYALRTLSRQLFFDTYKNVRHWLKQDDNPALNLILGESQSTQLKESWGESEGDSFTFAGEIEEQIERIPSAFWRNFTEELLEEFADGCIEAGYVIANSVDGYLAQQRMAQRLNDRQRVVEVQPDRSNEREKIILAGPEPQLKAALPTTLAHYQMIESRDVGQLVGQPLNDYVRNKELTLRLRFQLFDRPSPPYGSARNNLLTRVSITVPDVKRSALDWQQLKFAVGGPNGYLWGRYKARGRIDYRRYVIAHGGTEDEAVDRLRAVMQLSDARLQTINVTEELREGERLINPRLRKDATRVYPAYVTVINRDRTIAFDEGRASPEGNWVDRQARFNLWRDSPPVDFNERLTEVLRYSG